MIWRSEISNMEKSGLGFGLCALIILLFLSVSSASAGVITLQTRMTLSVRNQTVSVVITARNTGTDAARNLRAVVCMAGCRTESAARPLLPVQETAIFSVNIDVPPGTCGAFPVIGKILFHDVARHAFEAVNVTTFHLGRKTDPGLNVICGNLSLALEGRLPVHIGNMSDSPRQCRVTLFAPRAVSVPQNRQTLWLRPKEEKNLEFRIRCREKFDACYPVFCTVEYDDSEIHYARTVRGTIRIERDENWFKKTRWYWLAGVVPLLVLLLVAGLKGKRTED